MQAITEELRHLMQSTLLTANRGEQGKMDIDEEYNTTLAVRLKFSLTVWDYVIPVTPTLPAVFGVSFIDKQVFSGLYRVQIKLLRSAEEYAAFCFATAYCP